MPKFLILELSQVDILVVGTERTLAPMTVSSPNTIEIKLDRLIDEMRFLKSRTIAFDTRLCAIEAYIKLSEPSEQQPDRKFTPLLAAALFAIGAAVGATLTRLYLGI